MPGTGIETSLRLPRGWSAFRIPGPVTAARPETTAGAPDHWLVTGRGGVILIALTPGRAVVRGSETWIDGAHTGASAAVRDRARDAGERIARTVGAPQHVRAVIVVVGRVDTDIDPVGYHVVRARTLRRWLRGLPVVLAPAEVAVVAAAAHTAWPDRHGTDTGATL